MISDTEVPVLEASINRLAAAVDGACAKMDELRAEKRELKSLLNEFVEMDIPCPFKGNDGRLKDFAEWYKRVVTALRR